MKSHVYDEKYFLKMRSRAGPPSSPRKFRLLLPSVLKHANLILDAGCGKGECIEVAEKHGKNAIGIDISPFAARFSKQICGDVVNMPFRDETFDGVVAFEVIEHLTYGYGNRFLIECHRVLKKNGVLVLSTPNYLARFHAYLYDYSDTTHKTYYNIFSIKNALRSCGFVEIQITSELELNFPFRVQFKGISILALLGAGMLISCKKDFVIQNKDTLSRIELT